MLLKLQKNHLSAAPSKICTTTAELADAMGGFAGKKICTYLNYHSGTIYFMYAEVEASGTVNTGDAIAFVAPCPPFCTKGEDDMYALV